jgi:hypothetical protein
MATSYNSTIVTNGLVLCLDSANPKSYSTNVFTSPTDIYSWNTAGSNCTLSRDTIQSPVGSTPLKMVITGTDPYTIGYFGAAWKLAPAVSGQTWTISCWVKASVATTIEGIWVSEQDASGNYLTGGGASNPTIGTSWTRISGTYTLTNASTAFVGLRMDGTQTGGTGITVWWDGIQLERVSSISTFNSKTNTNGVNWFDQSGNNKTGTLVNTPTYSSANGGSLVFDGTSSYIEAGSIQPQQLTLSSWFKATGASNTNDAYGGVLVSNSPQLTGSAVQYSLNYSWLNQTCAVTIQANNVRITTPTDSALQNTINNAVTTYDGSTLNLYLNGVLSTSLSLSVTLVYPTTGNMNVQIGRWGYAGFLRNFAGNIYNTSIYNRALSAAEVSQNFNALRGRYGI